MPFERPDIIRPPSEARSYFLPLTAGCSNNSCTFCNFYGSKLQLREIAEVKQEIDALLLYMEHGVRLQGVPHIVYAIANEWDGKRIFLQDGDALVYPIDKLKETLEYLNAKFPCLERISAYATPQDITRLSVADLKELKQLKLGILYMGIESGDEAVRRSIGKAVSNSEMIDAVRKVKEAGILSSVTVILGLGGVPKSLEHAQATAGLLTRCDPDYVGALTLSLIPGTPLYDAAQRGDVALISPFQSLEELKIIVENADFTRCFFSSMHASNYFSIRGTLPSDKKRLVKELKGILERKDPRLLRPEFMRGL